MARWGWAAPPCNREAVLWAAFFCGSGLFDAWPGWLGGCIFALEGGDFPAVQQAPVTGLEAGVGEGADADAGEFFNPIANAPEHVADLAFQTLAEHDPERGRREQGDGFHAGAASLDVNPSGELGNEFGVEGLVNKDVVFLLGLVGGVGEVLAEFSIVGEDEEAFTFLVESSYVKESSKLRGDEVEDGFAVLLVGVGAEVAGGFVEEDVNVRLRTDDTASDADFIGRADLGREGLDGVAINGDAAGENELFAGSARAEACRGEVAVKAHEKSGRS